MSVFGEVSVNLFIRIIHILFKRGLLSGVREEVDIMAVSSLQSFKLCEI